MPREVNEFLSLRGLETVAEDEDIRDRSDLSDAGACDVLERDLRVPLRPATARPRAVDGWGATARRPRQSGRSRPPSCSRHTGLWVNVHGAHRPRAPDDDRVGAGGGVYEGPVLRPVQAGTLKRRPVGHVAVGAVGELGEHREADVVRPLGDGELRGSEPHPRDLGVDVEADVCAERRWCRPSVTVATTRKSSSRAAPANSGAVTVARAGAGRRGCREVDRDARRGRGYGRIVRRPGHRHTRRWGICATVPGRVRYREQMVEPRAR